MVRMLKTLLTLEQAEEIVAGTFAKGAEMGFLPLTIVVLDVGGNPILLKRADGCGNMRADVAIGKAWGALGMGLPSGVMGVMFKENQNFATGLVGASGGKFAPNPGGVLVLDDAGEVIGAVGASGDVGPNDEICVMAGVTAAGFGAAGTSDV